MAELDHYKDAPGYGISQERNIPKKGAGADKIRHFFKRFFDRESQFRRELEDEDFYKPQAFYEGHQWLLKSKATTDYRRAPRFTDWPESDPTPKPVDNQVMPLVDNEVSRLARRNSDFDVPPRGSDPETKSGAKLAEDILEDHLEKQNWTQIRRTHVFHKILYGTAILRSHLKTSYRKDKTVRVGIAGALRCMGTPVGMDMAGEMVPGMPSCGASLASKKLPFDKIEEMLLVQEGMSDRVMPTFEAEGQVKGYDAVRCPACGGRLEETKLSLEDAQGKDFFGRPLGKDMALGEAELENISPWEMFFENEGVGVSPESCTEFGIERPKSLKWVKEHFNKNVEDIVPDTPIKIAERFPYSGEFNASSRGAWTVTQGANQRHLYDHHVIIREFWSDIDRDNPRGRYIVTAGLDKLVVLEDGDLYVEDEKENLIPRVKVGISRCFIRDNMIWGIGFPRYVESDQSRLNMRLSQITDMAERLGIIAVLATRGMRLFRDWAKGLIGTVLRWEKDHTNPEAKPEIKTGDIQFSQWMQEIQDARETMASRLGIHDVEVGNVSGGELKSGIALQIAAEKSSERRQQREKEIVTAYEKAVSHQLVLIQHYYLEEEGRKYHAKVGNGREERDFNGLDLAGQTDVKVKESASFDMQLAGKQTLIEAVGNGQIQIMTPYAKREYAKAIGVPSGVMDEENLQIEAAERKFFDWREFGIMPSIDPNMDHHGIHWDTYGRLLLDYDSLELAKAAEWGKALKFLTGWEQGLMGAQQLSQQLSLFADRFGVPRDVMWQQQVLPQLAAQSVAPPPTGTPPPEALEDLIWWVWQNRLILRGFIQPQAQPPMTEEFAKYAQFKAIHEAHRILAQGPQMAAPPAPGLPQPQQVPTPQPPGLEAPQMNEQQVQ